MELGLSGRVVAVFGAARGIGAAIARAFADEGARVAAVDLSPDVVDFASQIPDSSAGWSMSSIMQPSVALPMRSRADQAHATT